MRTIDFSAFPITAVHPDAVTELQTFNRTRIICRPLSGNGLIEMGSLALSLKDFDYNVGYAKSEVELEYQDDPDVTGIFLSTTPALAFAKSRALHSDALTGFIVDADRRDGIRYGPGLGGVAMFISRDRIKRSVFAQTGVASLDPVRFFTEFELDSAPGAMIVSIADLFYHGLVQDNILMRSEIASVSLVETTIEIILGGLPHNFSHLYDKPAPLGAPPRLKRAVDYIHANAGLPLTVEDIAGVANLTVRSLYASFRRYYETTPKILLRTVRLQAVRRDIQAAGSQANIGEIARRWGFVHMGRFSNSYRRAFGELPSETDLVTKVSER